MDEVNITAARLDLAPMLEPIQREVAPHATAAESAWITTQLPGSVTLSYGGIGQLQTISTGGGVAAHTAILLDGIALNSPQFGSLDLSTLPLTRIGRVEYLPHGGSSTGSGTALSGAVNLVPRKITTGATLAAGAYGFRRAELSWANKTAGLVLGGQSYAGNFPYRYRGELLARENNGSEHYFLQGRIERSFKTTRVVTTAWFLRSARGIAGSTSALSNGARQFDGSGLVSIKADRITQSSRHRWQIYWQQQSNIFDAPDVGIHSDHQTNMGGLRYSLHRLWSPLLATLSQIEIRQESVTSTDAGEHRRYPSTVIQQVQLHLIKRLSFLATGRILAAGSAGSWTSAEAVLTWQLLEGNKWRSKVAIIATSQLRPPTFNDLYWAPGGNLDLRPEQSRITGARGTLEYGQIVTIRLEQYKTDFRDLIVWEPVSGGIWSPANIQSAWSRQTPLSVDLRSPGGHISLSLTASIIETANKAAGANHGKPLRFKPRESLTAMFTLLLPQHIRYVVQMTRQSGYITFYNYPRDDTQPGAENWNSFLAWQLTPVAIPFDFNITLGITNIADISHEFVPGYPEPGRSAALTLQMQRR